MGGADRTQSEIRIPSMRGPLRFWYRAVDPNFKDFEAKIFGSSVNQCQGALSMSIVQPPVQPTCNYNIIHERSRPGLKYLAYPLFINRATRLAIPAGTTFKIKHNILPWLKNDVADRTRRAVAAAWWLISTVGGMGQRCRRGLGSVRIISVDAENWSEAQMLQSGVAVEDVKQWEQIAKTNLQQIKDWFMEFNNVIHTALNKDSVLLLLGPKNTVFSSWQVALDWVGDLYKRFRSTLNHNERLSLGLPVQKRNGCTVKGQTHDRSASPMMINIIRINNAFYPVVMLFNCQILAPNERIKIDCRYGQPRVISKPGPVFIQKFLQYVKKNSYLLKEV